MYTIKQAAARSGVTVELLRAWERRYRVVHPQRTPAGYRLYDDADVSRLQAVRRLLSEGWSAGNAAAAVREMDADEIGRLVAAPPGRVSGEATIEPEELIVAFVAAARAVDQAGMEEILDQAFAHGSFERVAEGLLMPMLTAIGDAWAAGQLEVGSEHLASQLMQRRLGMAFQAAGRPLPGDRPILVGLPAGARHELGALAFAVAARRAGLPVVFLGPDLPAGDWVAAARGVAARAAVIGVPTDTDAAQAVGVVQALADGMPDLVIALGGAGAGSAAAPGVLRLPSNLGPSVDLLTETLRRRGA